ncbi:UNKNOWN [Stylonychia lemnae]|uniref:Uncharacterized protein n=1 Tax=Stylonychia lemnae TaxID=5949 RepID=A0A078AUC0_STYLE|nr:UNKNOWN [Stylonychia lemnae]|eukprot:CDW84443.1 UNKNOWN [Stylonychia lemnae]
MLSRQYPSSQTSQQDSSDDFPIKTHHNNMQSAQIFQQNQFTDNYRSSIDENSPYKDEYIDNEFQENEFKEQVNQATSQNDNGRNQKRGKLQNINANINADLLGSGHRKSGTMQINYTMTSLKSPVLKNKRNQVSQKAGSISQQSQASQSQNQQVKPNFINNQQMAQQLSLKDKAITRNTSKNQSLNQSRSNIVPSSSQGHARAGSNMDIDSIQRTQLQSSNLKQQNEPLDQDSNGSLVGNSNKTPQILLNMLGNLIREIEVYLPKSFDYLKALDLESDLKRAINNTPTGATQINEQLNFKITQFILDQESKIAAAQRSLNNSQINNSRLENSQKRLKQFNNEEEKLEDQQNNNNGTANQPLTTQQKKQQTKSMMLKQQFNPEQQEEYDQISALYEQSLSMIMAKDVMKFKSFIGKGPELPIGIAFLYYLVSQESSIMLSNDKKTIVNAQWEEVKKQFSNGGKVIFAFKKIRDYIESDLINISHFQQILFQQEQLNTFSINNEDSTLNIFASYLQNTISLTRFIKQVKGYTEDQLKPPVKRLANFRSPDRPRTSIISQNILNQGQNPSNHQQSKSSMRRFLSPEMSSSLHNISKQSIHIQRNTQQDFKNELNNLIHQQETENLQQSAEKKNQLYSQRLSLAQVQLNIKKMKFEMEREEKQALKEREKQEEQEYLNFQREQMLAEAKLQDERKQKEKEDFIRRQQEMIEENRKAKEYKKQEEDRLTRDNYDFEVEKQFKENEVRKKKDQELNQIKLNQIQIQEKERAEKEKYRQEKVEEQRQREEQRKVLLRTEMEELQKRERQLQDEIEFLRQMKSMPVRIPGSKR